MLITIKFTKPRRKKFNRKLREISKYAKTNECFKEFIGNLIYLKLMCENIN